MPRAKKAVAADSPIVAAYKGFRADLTCCPDGEPFQFEIGKTYRHEGKVKACKSGFHVITGHPLALFGYYAPAGTRICRVEISGRTDSDDNGEKTAAEILTVGEEIGLTQFILDAVKWVKERATVVPGNFTENDSTAVECKQTGGAATASGDWGAATASGYEGKVRGKEGCALFLVERASDGAILSVWAGIAGKDGIKPDVFYRLKDGTPVETE